MRFDLLSLVFAGILVAAPAWAQGEETTETDTTTETTTGTTETTGTEETGETGVTEDAPMPSSGGYPIAEIHRPLVLPPMMLEIRGGATFSRLAIDLGPLGSSSTNSIGLFAGGGFGVMPGLEAGIGGGFYTSGPGLGLFLLLSPDIDIGDLPLYGMYDLTEILGIPNLQIAGRLSFNLPLSSQFSILADAPAKYLITDMVAVIGTVGIGTQIGDGLNGLLIAVNGGALIQATEQISASATIGMLAFVGSNSSALIPLAIRGEFNIIEPLDAYVDFSFVDLNNWGPDWILIQGGVAYRLGF